MRGASHVRSARVARRMGLGSPARSLARSTNSLHLGNPPMPPTAARVRRLGRRAPILLAAVTVAALTLPALAAAAAPVRLIDSAHMTGGRITTVDGTVQFD